MRTTRPFVFANSLRRHGTTCPVETHQRQPFGGARAQVITLVSMPASDGAAVALDPTAAADNPSARIDAAPSGRRGWVALFAVAFAWRVFFIFDLPGMYAWDAFTRLWEHDTLLVRFWLPLPQLPVVCVASLGGEVFLLRCIYSLVGAGACVSVGLAVTRYWDGRIGLMTGWLVCLSPVFTRFTTVPYQEGMLVLFLGISLWAWPARESDGVSRGSPWIASAFLALAGLCRYEAWAIAVVLLIGSVARKRYRDVACVLPIFMVALLWVLLSPLRTGAPGPLVQREAFDVQLVVESIGTIAARVLEAAGTVSLFCMSEWVFFGFGFLLWGILRALLGGGFRGREWIVLGVLFFVLAVVRGVNSGVVTIRMALLPTVWGLPYLAVGVYALADWLMPLVRRSLSLALLCIVPTLFVLRSHVGAVWTRSDFQPEADAAKMLSGLPEDVRVRIVPRVIPNILHESAVGAIFAHSMQLDPRDRRWSYEGHPADEPREQPDKVLAWDGTQYVFDPSIGP